MIVRQRAPRARELEPRGVTNKKGSALGAKARQRSVFDGIDGWSPKRCSTKRAA
jgi:hypothetical protein